MNEDAIFEAIDAMRSLAEFASTCTKTIRRQRERRRHWAHKSVLPWSLPAVAAPSSPHLTTPF